jgi:hypothetical protein
MFLEGQTQLVNGLNYSFEDYKSRYLPCYFSRCQNLSPSRFVLPHTNISYSRMMAVKTMLAAVFFLILHHSIAADSISSYGSSEVVIYPIPSGMPTIDSYTIQVKPSGAPRGQYQSVGAYHTLFSEVNTTSGGGILHNSSVAYFDFSGSVDLSIKYNTDHVQNVFMRPYSYGIVPSASGGNLLEFTLTSPTAIIIEINGDIWDTLQLFTHPIETDIPDPSDPDVLYFGPGINNGTAYKNVTGGTLSLGKRSILREEGFLKL